MRLVQNGDCKKSAVEFAGEVCGWQQLLSGTCVPSLDVGAGGAIAAVLLAIASGTEEGIDGNSRCPRTGDGLRQRRRRLFDPDAVLPWAAVREARGPISTRSS